MIENPNKKPANFNWIEARSKCSLREMFEQLKLGIREDVERFNGSLAPDDTNKFTVVEDAKTMKVLSGDGFKDDSSVVFVLKGNVIRVGSVEKNQILFDVKIGLNDDGDCKFSIDGKEFDSWQIRRKALEDLLFWRDK
jgi:hypothetical protein